MAGLFHRIGERERRPVRLVVDGTPLEALEGDTLLVAILTQRAALRLNEFDGGPRAGFCLMGACQDCRVWTEAGESLRACSTPVAEGMRILTREVAWTGQP
ncbi:(2Fe-2S)-binding protein [Belnapia sp. T6]|uniref:(2Fe-2S)-binding protein n=1 Tax=Belnapia mucosa TaxID=2804532 RepID=A0ABS1V5Z7_9PROT|nr:(2Fe-2S)-binding protein [Belnapia mucosa]MBL6457110.1 (2Fe-2S)-binding protein [Belnapia mucosa]